LGGGGGCLHAVSVTQLYTWLRSRTPAEPAAGANCTAHSPRRTGCHLPGMRGRAFAKATRCACRTSLCCNCGKVPGVGVGGQATHYSADRSLRSTRLR
jgi:hypothetical protein